ncbi:hypothetical protein ALMP_55640 [Streptomyces sp. A012304]|nr:hypothetical protein ALMP_55640 [Streptomyces sp. A012304]
MLAKRHQHAVLRGAAPPALACLEDQLHFVAHGQFLETVHGRSRHRVEHIITTLQREEGARITAGSHAKE